MAHTTLTKYFFVYPRAGRLYRWEIRDTRKGTRAVSKHKYLNFALLEAEALNRIAAEQEAKSISKKKEKSDV